jgi:hypothetical protein
LSEWIAYAELEPFGTGYIADLIGMLCATIANFSQMEVKEKGRRKSWSPSDFIPDTITPPKKRIVKKQSVEDMANVLKTIATSGNRGQKRKKA